MPYALDALDVVFGVAGSGAVGRVMDALDWVEIVEGEELRSSFGCKCGASHCNQWGL